MVNQQVKFETDSGLRKLGGVLALGAAAVGGGKAATVQISLTNNFISHDTNSLNADVTGDGLADLLFDQVINTLVATANSSPGGFVFSGRTSALASVVPYARAGAWIVFGTGFGTTFGASASIAPSLGLATSGAPTPPVSARALYPIAFVDARYGGAVDAWLDIEAWSPANLAPNFEAYVRFNRVIWDDSDLATRPAGLNADDPEFEEAIPVPEPSGLALLALGAGGLLARRRRARN